jgi:C-terminal processing protease CtpA/Prc
MSGLHLLRADGETRVYSVDDHSPADADGIRPDDVIAAVDGRSAAAMTMRDIRLRLQTRDGDKVALQVRRGESVFATVLVLKQEL